MGTHISTVASDHEDDGLFAQVRQRDDISLFTLTKQFVLEIKKQHDCSIDLNTMAEKLCVQKRRVYDMTCVLEGIGLLVKKQKNVVTWMPPVELLKPKAPQEQDDGVVGEPAVSRTGSGDGKDEHDADEIERQKAALQRDVAALAEQEKEYTKAIKAQCQHLQKLVKAEGACMSVDTLLSLFKENLVLVIHAPPGTELRVPDPFLSPTPKYQLKLSSNTGGIRIRVLRNNRTSADPPNAAVSEPHPPPPPIYTDLGHHYPLIDWMV